MERGGGGGAYYSIIVLKANKSVKVNASLLQKVCKHSCNGASSII